MRSRGCGPGSPPETWASPSGSWASIDPAMPPELKALSAGPVPRRDAATIMQRDDLTTSRLIDDLVAEGLCERAGPHLHLPR